MSSMQMLTKRSNLERAFSDLLRMLFFWIMRSLQRLGFRTPGRLERFQTTVRKIAFNILERGKGSASGEVPQGKDIMSILVRSNLAEDPKRKLAEEELLAQTTHDTASSTLQWALYELSRHPEVQQRLRAEVKNSESSDQETLRYYPIVAHNFKRAGRDEVIPLSTPIKTRDGQKSNVVLIKKGQAVLMSAWAYNRVEELWGKDADQWSPNRFLQDVKHQMSLGVYANSATFGSGVHSCIG
ncbi:hypothetical protein M422DRAFT_247065 [Sphaerobolus stellatus SS14]|nr:hypothetical protein M422DRAFT_247065 [Sphaerobolus stellatus SS14]